MEKSLLRLEGIKKYYANDGTVTMGLGGVSMSFSRGEFVAVTGESGSGKSTLAHVISGILPYEGGEMLFNGDRTSHFGPAEWEQYRRDNISFISQSYGILPGASVMENVMSALLLSGMNKKSARVSAESILRKVELWSMRRRRAAKLSSGQKQRLSIARALAKPAPILVADEPTGNLDAENSRKIIELLANVAEERLVILITHEFSEAEHYATRHIVIKDGRITANISLRPAYPVKEGNTEKKQKKPSRGLGIYIARLQAASRPVWSAAVFLIFAFTAFSVFAFLGVFISNFDDSFTYSYDGSAFPNGNEKRLVVAAYEGKILTKEDSEKILSAEHVEYVDLGDGAVDVQYAYRKGIDFNVTYKDENDPYDMGASSFTSAAAEVITILDDAPYIRTMPVGREADGFISEGRAPEGLYEVAAGRGEAEIGDLIDVYIYDRKHWGVQQYVKQTLEVVGISDKISELCFGNDFTLYFNHVGSNPDLSWSVMWSDDVATGTFQCARDQVNRISNGYYNGYYYIVNFPVADPKSFGSDTLALDWAFEWESENRDNGIIVSKGSGIVHNIDISGLYLVSHEDFHTILGDDISSKQASVFIEDYVYADAVMGKLNEMGYSAISPYRIGLATQDEELAAERLQTLKICLAALAAIILLQTILLTAMFSVQKETFRTLGDIGLTGRTAAFSVVTQLFFFTLTGQAAAFFGIKLCERAGVERIIGLLRYLEFPMILIPSAFHIAAAALAGVFIILSIEKKVYPMESKRRDMIGDEALAEQI